MERKICVLIITLIMCISSMIIVNNYVNFGVEATSGGGGDGGNGSIDLDYDFMWNVTNDLSDVVHNDSIWGYGDEVIRMGRSFGTKGDNYTADYLRNIMYYDLGLENAKKIKTMKGNPEIKRMLLFKPLTYIHKLFTSSFYFYNPLLPHAEHLPLN